MQHRHPIEHQLLQQHTTTADLSTASQRYADRSQQDVYPPHMASIDCIIKRKDWSNDLVAFWHRHLNMA